MNWILIIIIVVGIYYFFKWRESKKPENIIRAFETEAYKWKKEYEKYYIMNYRMLSDENKKRLANTNKSIFELDTFGPFWKRYIERFESWYNELAEKDKHTPKKLIENATDFKDFFYYLWEIESASTGLMVSYGGEEATYYSNERDEWMAKIQQIQKRFTSKLRMDWDKINKEDSNMYERLSPFKDFDETLEDLNK